MNTAALALFVGVAVYFVLPAVFCALGWLFAAAESTDPYMQERP